MQTKIIKNITVLFALLFSAGLFAQNIEVSEINKKMKLSPAEEGEHISYLAFGAASSIFINEGTADKNQRSWEGILTTNLENATELTSVTEEFGGELHDIEMINILWDGTPFSFDEAALNKLPELKYVFVRSYKKLDENTLLSSLPSLMTQLEKKGGVIVLYQTIETAQ